MASATPTVLPSHRPRRPDTQDQATGLSRMRMREGGPVRENSQPRDGAGFLQVGLL
jgi:hypothetical protein